MLGGAAYYYALCVRNGRQKLSGWQTSSTPPSSAAPQTAFQIFKSAGLGTPLAQAAAARLSSATAPVGGDERQGLLSLRRGETGAAAAKALLLGKGGVYGGGR